MPSRTQPNERLAALRRSRGWTQDDLANRVAAVIQRTSGRTVAINADHISRLERGLIGRPGPLYRKAMCAIFDATEPELGFIRKKPEPPSPTRLPAPIGDFVGRVDAVRELVHALTGPAGRTVAIHGIGGVGKSTLAARVAHAVSPVFPDVQLYATLRAAHATPAEPADILARFLTELGVAASSMPVGIEDRARLLGTELDGRAALMVLDNAVDEKQVRPLIPSSVSCAVLITSRKPLTGLGGAHHLRLDAMTRDESVHLLERIAGRERAARAPEAIAELARRCSELPLLLRLTGRWLATTPLTALGERYTLDLLAPADRTIDDTIAGGYRACPAPMQRAFRLVSVIETADFGSWTLALLAGVAPPEAETLLDGLVDAGLLERTIGQDDLSRYRFHDVLRAFARERLTAEDGPGLRQVSVERLLTEYVRLGTNAAALLDPAGPAVATPALPAAMEMVRADPVHWMQAERAAFLVGVQQAFKAELWDLAWQLAELLPACWGPGGGGPIARQTAQHGLTAAINSGNRAGEARIRSTLGALDHAQARYEHAITELNCSVAIFEDLGDELRAASARRQRGATYRHIGLLDVAIGEYTEALTVFERVGNQRMIAAALNGLGDSYRMLSRWPAAVACLDRSLTLYDRLGDQLEIARTTVRLGCVYRDQSSHTRAEQLFQEALEAFQVFGDRRWEARALRNLAIVHRNCGDPEQALHYLDESLARMDELADLAGYAVVLCNIGDTHRYTGDIEPAERVLVAALHRFHQLGDTRSQARTHLRLADVARHRRDWIDAKDHLDQARAVFRRIEDPPGVARLHHYQGLLARDQGLWSAAHAALADSERLFLALGDRLWQARTLAVRASVYLAAGDRDWHRDRERAEQICRECGARTDDDLAVWLYEW